MTDTMVATRSPRERELRGHDTRRYQLPMHDDSTVKLCECGCGNPAPISKHTRRDRGQFEGQPVRFINGHNSRGNQYNVKHGQKRVGGETTEYRIWSGMIARCTNQNVLAFPRYGGRGITVCDRWRTFENFFADMGPRPKGLSLDRINNDGNYEPSNCRWATAKQQRANRRDSA